MSLRLFLISSLVAAFLPPATVARQEGAPCGAEVKYVDRNQADPRQLSVLLVRGRVFVEVGEISGETTETSALPDACLGLFTEKEHRLVAATSSDEKGQYAFGAVPAGEYRLVVHSGPFCVANVRVRVTRGGRAKGKRVVVHMRAAGYDTCSYADYK
jgi:hypothetical protein